MSTVTGNFTRLSDFKNHDKKNLQEMRRRRAEVSIKIRRAKKDDHLHKRRNIDSDDKLLCAQQETHDLDATYTRIEEIVNAINSGDKDKEIKAMKSTSFILSRERNPPIDNIV